MFAYCVICLELLKILLSTGSPYYEDGAIIGATATPGKKGVIRRSLSLTPNKKSLEMPVSHEVINSLAPLCLPGKYTFCPRDGGMGAGGGDWDLGNRGQWGLLPIVEYFLKSLFEFWLSVYNFRQSVNKFNL